MLYCEQLSTAGCAEPSGSSRVSTVITYASMEFAPALASLNANSLQQHLAAAVNATVTLNFTTAPRRVAPTDLAPPVPPRNHLPYQPLVEDYPDPLWPLVPEDTGEIGGEG